MFERSNSKMSYGYRQPPPVRQFNDDFEHGEAGLVRGIRRSR